MIIMWYAVACDGCGAFTPSAEWSDGSGIVRFETSGGARAHARWSRWMRIGRGDPRDQSRRKRGEDLCPPCAKIRFPDWRPPARPNRRG